MQLYFNKFNNIKVVWQIRIITLLSIFTLLAMQLNSYTDANQVTGANINTENIAYKANLFSKIYTYGLQMRRSEKDYLNRLQDKYIKKYEAA